MKILMLDNYDSFTYNIVHIIKELGYLDVDVVRNDKITLEEVEKYDKIVLSPGPGIPSEAGLLLPIIKEYYKSKSILGICLGHQAIGEAFGSSLENLKDVYHGVSSKIYFKEKDYIFDGIETPFEVGRYHSWVISKDSLPESLVLTSIDENNEIMSIKAKDYDVHGVQFHPESVLTPQGKKIISNFLSKK
ncbi:MAG: aminodeoxychorismate/anthranilate synthase component II [Bacteroidales bacterium]|nr:aminodeoxychorismate/anthranilate synthase component II [Bacteroidales bacterium]